jgi:hypothetical protein
MVGTLLLSLRHSRAPVVETRQRGSATLTRGSVRSSLLQE